MKHLRLLAAFLGAVPAGGLPLGAHAQVTLALTIGTPPPPIPAYVQPYAPAANSIWQPGYWAWGPAGYYWVPGTWVLAPQPGLLWTPGYWNWNGLGYVWMPGYWAPAVGYYGGINYGAGYFGTGYVGGMWVHNVFEYNTYVTRVNQIIVVNHVYYRVYPRPTWNRVDWVGGHGGLITHPTAAQLAIARSRHWPMTALQRQHAQYAAENRNFYANVNHGRPAVPVVMHPLSASNRPANFAPVTTTDRRSAQVYHPMTHAAAPAYRAPQHAAAPAYHAPQHAAAPAYHAPVAHNYQHAAPQAHPMQHAAPHHAATQHAAPQHPESHGSGGDHQHQ